MILPCPAEVVEFAKNGTLLEAIFSDRWQCRYQHFDAIAQRLADIHNEGKVDLLDTLSASGLAAFGGHEGYQGRKIYSMALERLDTSVTVLLRGLRILAAQAEGEPHEATETLRVWCSASPNRPRELLALIDAGEVDICDLYSLHIAIRTGLKADLSYFSERAYALIQNGTAVEKGQVIQALSSPPFDDDTQWRRALDVFEESVLIESDDELRSALTRTLLSFTESIPQRLATKLEELVSQVSVPTTLKVAHHLAYALAFSFKAIPLQLRICLLTLLGAVQLEGQTQKLVDLGLAHLVKAGGADQARAFITNLLLQPDTNLRFQHFDSTIRNLVKEPAPNFETWIVDWLRTAPNSLCRELNEAFFSDRKDYAFQMDFSLFNFTESEHILIARRATAIFFMNPAVAASFLVNLGRCPPRPNTDSAFGYFNQQSYEQPEKEQLKHPVQPHELPSELSGAEDWHTVLSDLLFDPLLINYTSAQEHLQPIAEDSADKATAMVKRALESYKQYCEGIEKVGFIVEFRPSERERQLENQRRSDVMNDAMRASRKSSPFAGIFSESILLYGNGVVTWVEDGPSPENGDEQDDSRPRRLEQPLASISHSVEWPREEILEPVSLQMKLLSLQNIGGRE